MTAVTKGEERGWGGSISNQKGKKLEHLEVLSSQGRKKISHVTGRIAQVQDKIDHTKDKSFSNTTGIAPTSPI